MEAALTIIVVTFGQYNHWLPILLHSLCLQSRKDFKVLVYHDGPVTCKHSNDSSVGTKYVVEQFERTLDLTYVETDVHYHFAPKKMDWGHTLRDMALKTVGTEWVCFTNGDNYYTPKFVEFMLDTADKEALDFVYCNLLHNYNNVNGDGSGPYHVLESQPHVNRIDMMNFMVKTKLAQEVGFAHRCIEADGLFVMDLRKANPEMKIGKLTNALAVHN